MITIWKYPVITWYGVIILQTINEEAFVYIINTFYLWESSMFNICKSVLILKWKLATQFVTLYLFISNFRSPSQTLDNFETFSKNFELNLENIVHRNSFLVVVIRNFNAKSSKWHCQDKSTLEGNVIDSITSQFGLYQVTKEPTHILNTSSLSIDHIFTSLPSLIIDSGVHSSLQPNCRYQIVYAKFNLEITYPPPSP